MDSPFDTEAAAAARRFTERTAGRLDLGDAGLALRDDRLTESVDGAQTSGPCQVLWSGADVALLGYRPGDDPDLDVTWLCDLVGARALRIAVASVQDAGDRRAIVARRHFGGGPFPPTRALARRRFVWDYGDGHVVEHLYLGEHLMVWHDVTGARGDLERYDAVMIDADRYLVHWSERDLARTVALVIDAAAGRNTGFVYGWQPDTRTNLHAAVTAAGVVDETMPLRPGGESADPGRPG